MIEFCKKHYPPMPEGFGNVVVTTTLPNFSCDKCKIEELEDKLRKLSEYSNISSTETTQVGQVTETVFHLTDEATEQLRIHSHLPPAHIQPELLQTLRQQLGDERVQSILIKDSLTKYFEDHPIENEQLDTDLNPHLYIKFVAANVATDVSHQGIPCSDQDVILLWLISTMYGEFLPKKQTPTAVETSPKCPKCNGWIDNTVAADGTWNCANCKHRWRWLR